MPAIKLTFDISIQDDIVKQQERIMCEYLQNMTQLMHLSSERRFNLRRQIPRLGIE